MSPTFVRKSIVIHIAIETDRTEINVFIRSGMMIPDFYSHI